MTPHAVTHNGPAAGLTGAAPAVRPVPSGLPTGPNDALHARVLSRCVEDLAGKYGSDLPAGLIRRTVQSAYRELDATARLKTYLPVLAANLAEERLRTLTRQARHVPAAVTAAAPDAGPTVTDRASTYPAAERAAA